MKVIKTQKELDKLVKTGVLKGEEVDIVGSGLKLSANLSVYGFLRISATVEMNYLRQVEAWGSSRVEARESSQVEARESSQVEAWESSRVEAWGSVSVHYFSLRASLALWGYSSVHKMVEGKGDITKKQKTATVIEVPKFVGSWTNYKANYPVVEKGKKVLMYKTVHKAADGTFFADYDKSFKYVIGMSYEQENAPKSSNSCAIGLHVAHKSWALSFGSSWDDMALIECEIDPKNIVVADDCDGKVRTSKLTVIREVPKEEYYA